MKSSHVDTKSTHGCITFVVFVTIMYSSSNSLHLNKTLLINHSYSTLTAPLQGFEFEATLIMNSAMFNLVEALPVRIYVERTVM